MIAAGIVFGVLGMVIGFFGIHKGSRGNFVGGLLVFALGVVLFARGTYHQEHPVSVVEAEVTTMVDTTDVMVALHRDIKAGMATFDSLLALKEARPFPKNGYYIERNIYDRCADVLLTTTRVLERTTFRSPEHQRAIAALAMREWRPRYMQFRHFRTGYGAFGHDDGRDWMSLSQMGYQYIAVLEPAFEDANSIATHIDAGSE
ncbi:MAG: hypothetical protein V1778_01670 [bacterium]